MSERFFNWLLKLYPRRFRGEYGDAMRQLFHDRLRAETGWAKRTRLAFDILCDLVISLPREHARPAGVAPGEPGRYRLSEEAIARMSWGGHSRQFLAGIVLFVSCYVIALVGGAPPLLLTATYGLMLSVAITTMFRHRSRFRRMMRGYELVLGSEQIRQLGDASELRALHRDEIAKLTEYSFGIAIEGKQAAQSIWVPSGINGYEDLKTRLIKWAPLEQAPMGPVLHLRSLILLAMVGLLPAALLARSEYVVIPMLALDVVPLGVLMRAAVADRTRQRGSFKVMWVIPILIAVSLAWKALTLLR